MDDRIKAVMLELEVEDARERELGLPPSQRMRAISPEVGTFLYMLVRSSKATHVIEIGCSRGYSSLWLGVAARENGGQVTTYEIDPARAKIARANHARAGLSEIIRIVEGDARKELPKLKESIDFAFIDAEKDDYISHFDAAWKRTRKGGLVVADNVLSHADDLSEYIRYVRGLPDGFSMTVPIGRGEEVTLKNG